MIVTTKFLYCIYSNILIDYVIVFGLEPEGGSSITPIALAHPPSY